MGFVDADESPGTNPIILLFIGNIPKFALKSHEIPSKSPFRMKLAGSPHPSGQVEDYLVAPLADGVKDTAAIRVAATLLPEGIVGAPERPHGPRRKALFVGIC